MQNIWSTSGLLLILTLSIAAGAGAENRAPDFTLPSLAGEKVTLSEANADRAVLVSFWATWCVPCPQEMKHLQRLYKKYHEQGFEILAVSIDGNKSVAKVKPFIQGHRFTFPVLLDTNNDLMRRYRVKAVPAVFLLAPGRELTYYHTGYKPGDEVALEAEIRKVLALPSVKAGQPAAAGESAASDEEPRPDEEAAADKQPPPAEKTPSNEEAPPDTQAAPGANASSEETPGNAPAGSADPENVAGTAAH